MSDLGEPRVVNAAQEAYDVFIGYGNCPRTGRPSRWINRYSSNPKTPPRYLTNSIAESVYRYAEEAANDQMLYYIERSMRNMVLGCWCKTPLQPDALCHGDVLLRLANPQIYSQDDFTSFLETVRLRIPGEFKKQTYFAKL